MVRRLNHIHRHAPSLMARTIAAKTLLASCLWYFVQFEAVSAADAARASDLIIIDPAVMTKALQAKMVNQMLLARGQWWTAWSEAIVERAARTGPGTGVDGLAVASARASIAAACSPFWRAALQAWIALKLAPVHPAGYTLPARHVGARLVTLDVRRQQPRRAVALKTCCGAPHVPAAPRDRVAFTSR